MKHTKEPWSINDWPQDTTDITIGAVLTPLIAKVPLRDVSINEQKANARRIVACINACDGFSIEELEGANLFADSIESNAEIIALKKQQIDLLVTMNQIKSATPDGGCINTLARKAISAAGDSQNNRRLLELAANASGWMPNNSWAWCANAGKNGAFCYRLNGEMIAWNPLDDNADAFSLAVKLRIEITYNEEHKCICRFWTNTEGFMAVAEQIGDDPCAATRRAIVRAAAKIAISGG